MTRDEQLIKAALDMAAETAGTQMAKITRTPYAAGGRVFAAAIRAIDPADVLAKMGDERCAKCGHPRRNHPYRHPFVGMGNDPSATQPAPDAVARLVKAAEFFDRRRKSIEDDVSSGHSGRGPGASSWMREDDSDFRLDLRNAFDALSSALAAFKEVRDE